LAEQGIAGISVNAIAKRMGVTGPALYRYFSGRDELLNDLVRDAWHDLADTVEAEVAASEGASPPDRVRAFAAVFRTWAITQPHRYLLLFGTPLPGYHAPEDTALVAHRTMSALLRVLPHEDPHEDAHATTTRPSTLDAQLVAWGSGLGEGELPPPGCSPACVRSPGCTACSAWRSPAGSGRWGSTRRCSTAPRSSP
jgi:AcrR family transcriptional regulator